MIYILHGDDSKSSYTRLNLLANNFANTRRINLFGKETTKEQFVNVVSAQNLFEENELIIGHNLIKNKIAEATNFKKIPDTKHVILWEDSELTNLQLSKYKSIANIEIFKLPTILYAFLDSIAPGSKQLFANIQKLNAEKNENLCWMLLNRFFLLILAKENYTYQRASELNGKIGRGKLFDWQWQKIKNQSYDFNHESLYALYSGVLKIDHMQKNGSTNLDEITLINILFFKYLKPQINATIKLTAHGRHSMV